MLRRLAAGGDDEYLEEDAPSALAEGGDDDCVEGGCSLSFSSGW